MWVQIKILNILHHTLKGLASCSCFLCKIPLGKMYYNSYSSKTIQVNSTLNKHAYTISCNFYRCKNLDEKKSGIFLTFCSEHSLWLQVRNQLHVLSEK